MLTHKIHSELDDVYIGRKLTFFLVFYQHDKSIM